ncbi:MAG: type II secretion system protein [Clostridiales bacterium]|nr:type II secretion system protein [Clostridiales bacterium]
MKLKKDKGITLTSLVITIGVMTILAGTVVVVALNEGGIIGKAGEAKESVEDAGVYQDIIHAVLTSKNKNGKINEEALTKKLKKIDNSTNIVKNESTNSYIVTVKGDNYIIEEYGNVTVQE